jgi:ABC-2 type transport system permease protein
MQTTYSSDNAKTPQDHPTQATAAAAAAATAAVAAKPPTGPLVGFGHILKKQMRDWYGTRKWLWVGGMSALIAAGLQLAMYLGAQLAAQEGESIPVDVLTQMPMILLGNIFIMIPVLVSIGEVIEEKKSGTAAWIMSKPVSRFSFILSKWVATSINVTALALLIPGIASFALASLLFGVNFEISSVGAALGILALYYTMMVAATLFLGVVMKSQGAVAAVAIGSITLMPMMTILPDVVIALLPTTMATAATALVQTGELMSYIPVISGAVILIVSLVAAAVLFNRQEL